MHGSDINRTIVRTTREQRPRAADHTQTKSGVVMPVVAYTVVAARGAAGGGVAWPCGPWRAGGCSCTAGSPAAWCTLLKVPTCSVRNANGKTESEPSKG